MADQTIFTLDGKAYDVDVMALKRKFSVLDSDKSGRTQNGEMYRDVIGTFYNYSMIVVQKGDNAAALDELWTAISKPDVSHVCVFPYGQSILTQRMYVTSGEQDLKRMSPGRNDWGEIKIEFIAMSPKVMP